MASTLTLTSAAFASSGAFGQAMTAGRGATALPVITAAPFCISLRIKVSPSGGVIVACAQNLCGWVGIDAAGMLIAKYGSGGTEVTLQSSTNVANDAWHHVELNVDATGAKLYSDGALAISNATTPAAAGCQFSGVFEVRSFNNSFLWTGAVDEVATFSAVQHTGTFAINTAPYTGSENNLAALWHLDGNGADNSAIAGIIRCDNAAFVYSPYNWLVSSGNAKTINAGAYFRVLFSGTSCLLNFDLTGTAFPFPRIRVVVDGITNQIATVLPTIAVILPPGQNNVTHLLEVWVEATSRSLDRWGSQQTAVKFTGLTLSGGFSSVYPPSKFTKNILVYGDSITEGTLTLTNAAPQDVDGSSATVSWALELGKILDAEVGVVGFAATGLVTTGVGNVPALPNTWPWLWNGTPRTFTQAPDFCIWLEGTNDNANNTVSAGISALNGMQAAMPSTRFALFRPLNGTAQEANLQAIVAGCTTPARAAYLTTAGFWSTADSSDNLHPYGYACDKIARSMAAAIENQFDTGTDNYPDPVTIAPVTALPSTTATTSALTLSNFVGALQLTVTDGLSSVDAGAFTSAAKSVTAGQTFRLQGTANATPGASVVVGFALAAGAVTVDAGNFVIITNAQAVDTTPTAPTLAPVLNATVGDYVPTTLFTVAGVTAGVDIPIITGPGVQVRIATTTGGTLGAIQTGTINTRLGYDVQPLGLVVQGTVTRSLVFGGLLLNFDVSSSASSSTSIAPARIWKIGTNGPAAYQLGSELMRGPNGGVRTVKDPDAHLDYAIDWGAASLVDPLVTAVLIADGVTVTPLTQTASIVGFLVVGGAVGYRARVTVRVTRVSGVVEDRSIDFKIIQL